MKYEGPKSYQSKDMANLKVSADKLMDARTDWPKTICLRLWMQGIKMLNYAKI